MLHVQGPKGQEGHSDSGGPDEADELRFRFECDSVDEFGAIYAPDISRGGIFIRTVELLPLASSVKLDLQLADGTSFISGEGLVFWLRQPDQIGTQGEPGMGIRFTKITAESHRNLVRILAVKEAEEALQAAADSDFDDGHNESTLVANDQDIRAAASAWSMKMRVPHGTAQTVPLSASAASSAGAKADDSDEAFLEPDVVTTSPPETTSPGVQAMESGCAGDTVPATSGPADTAPAAEPEPAAPVTAPASIRPSLSRPVPALPDWAFVSTRFAVEDRAAGNANDVDVAVPQHIGDDRRSALELSAPGEAASGRAASPRSPAVSGKAAAVSFAARGGGTVGLLLGAALVLVAALALAPHPKSRPGAGPRERSHPAVVSGVVPTPAPVSAAAGASSSPAGASDSGRQSPSYR